MWPPWFLFLAAVTSATHCGIDPNNTFPSQAGFLWRDPEPCPFDLYEFCKTFFWLCSMGLMVFSKSTSGIHQEYMLPWIGIASKPLFSPMFAPRFDELKHVETSRKRQIIADRSAQGVTLKLLKRSWPTHQLVTEVAAILLSEVQILQISDSVRWSRMASKATRSSKFWVCSGEIHG